MNQRLTPGTIALLLIPPMLWAGNAVVGRMASGMVPPILLNFLRWLLAGLILLPLAGWIFRPGSGLLRSWKRFALLGLLGVGLYNALQYMALKTSTPINVTLVASSTPVFMLAIGGLFFGQRIRRRQVLGAVLSMAGVLLVLARGQWEVLRQFSLAPGDFFVLLATAAWAWYSWLLSRRDEPEAIRADWAAFLLAQVAFGLLWSGAFAAGEWTLSEPVIAWGWPLAAVLLYVAVGPAVIAYRCWGLAVQRVGPNVAGFFINFTPLIAALLSSVLLGEAPHLYHAAAFVLIVGGIVVSSRQ